MVLTLKPFWKDFDACITGADDDDDYEDECVAETWRDGGVLSEADA